MKNTFKDITDQLGRPIWYEETGHPRYCEFAPKRTYNCYTDEVALIEIACQNCGLRVWVTLNGDRHAPYTLAEQIEANTIKYGDPPNNDCCPVGAVMTAEEIRVVEFWQRNDEGEFVRVPELESWIGELREKSRRLSKQPPTTPGDAK